MVTKLDRLARSLPDARSIADELTDRSVRLISLAAADAIRRRPGTACRRSVLLGEGWRNAQFARIGLYLDAAEGIALRPPVGRRMAGAMLVGVFERFTDRSRRVLVLAQEEARLLGHSFIGTEHILLGLIHEGDGVAAKALEALEIHSEAVRREVEKTVGLVGPSGQAPVGSPPFTPRAKRVLELSLREALQLGHNYIGTEHMLLGLIREGEGVAAQVLTTLGADLARVRQQVIVLLGGQASPEAIEAVGV
ncbi:MAG: Clp protease N-terminal domain-containing protein, partial [Acidimicrobiales bacterium]